MTAPVPLREQIAAVLDAGEIIAANGGAIERNGWGDAAKAVRPGLIDAVKTLSWLARNEPAIRAALAGSGSRAARIEAAAKAMFCQHYQRELWEMADCRDRFLDDATVAIDAVIRAALANPVSKDSETC